MRSSPVIAPPSVVATIFFLISSSLPWRSRSFFAIGSLSGTVCSLSSSASRTASMWSTSVLMSPNSACAFIIASKCALRSAAVNGARRSSPITSLVSLTSLPRVSRTVYVPGTTRGPCDDPNATCAARGTRGGLTRIGPADAVDAEVLARRDRVDQLALVVEHLELDRPVDVARAQVVRDHRAARRVVADERRVALDPAAVRRHPLLHRPRPAGTRSAPGASGSVSARSGVRSSMIQMPRPCVATHEVAVARVNLDLAHRDVREVVALELRPVRAARRSRSTGRTRCRGTAGPS